MADFVGWLTKTILSTRAARASSIANWISGLSMTGNNSFGVPLVGYNEQISVINKNLNGQLDWNQLCDDYFSDESYHVLLYICGGEKSDVTDKVSTLEFMRKLGPGGQLLPSEIQSKRNELTHELQKYMHILGPTPKRCLETFADLGLSDPEIARYFKIPRGIVTDLRQVWKIDGET